MNRKTTNRAAPSSGGSGGLAKLSDGQLMRRLASTRKRRRRRHAKSPSLKGDFNAGKAGLVAQAQLLRRAPTSLKNLDTATLTAEEARVVAEANKIKRVVLDYSSGMVLADLNRTLVEINGAGPYESGLNASQDFHASYSVIASIEMGCRDPVEEMFVRQLIWCHARIAKLSSCAAFQDERRNVVAVNGALDSAINTFRRLAMALHEYRRPYSSGGPSFTAIRQLNAAGQQVVANGPLPTAERLPSNEQGSAAAALPAVTSGSAIPANRGDANPAVAMEHGTANGDGQGALPVQRLEARPAVCTGSPTAARVGEHAGADASDGARRGRANRHGVTGRVRGPNHNKS